MTSLAFDPKWDQVFCMAYFEGDSGQTVMASEKGGPFTPTSCTITTAVSRWGKGSANFPSDTTNRSISVAGPGAFYTNVPQAIQSSFYANDVSGARYIFSFSSRIALYIESGVLTLKVRTTSSATPEYTITTPVVIGQWYDYAIRFDATGCSLELNSSIVGSQNWGAETHTSSAGGYIGNNAASLSAAASFRGYIGPLRWTFGDKRAEDIGAPAYRFPVLGAADPYREKVIFHSRFDGLNLATSAVDIKGKTIVFSGAARLETSYRKSGVSSFRANGGTGLIAHADFQFGTDDFAIEFFCSRSGDTTNREYLFSLMDVSGVDHALSLSGRGYGGTGYLRVAGVDVASASPVAPDQNTFYHYAVVREGATLSVFRNGLRVLTHNIGSAAINSNGQFYIGKGGTAAPGNASLYDYLDEIRITRAASRYNPLSSTISAPTEKFNEFGPKSLAGQVLDDAGNPIARIVRAYHRASGRFVSETTSHPTTGNFILPVDGVDEFFVVAFDAAKNALVYDHVVPELI